MCLDGVFLKAIRPFCLFQRQCLRACGRSRCWPSRSGTGDKPVKAKGTEGGRVISMASMTPMILDLGVLWQGLIRGLHVPGKGQEGQQGQQVGKQDQVAVVTRSAQVTAHGTGIYDGIEKSTFNSPMCSKPCGMLWLQSLRFPPPSPDAGPIHNYRARYSGTVL